MTQKEKKNWKPFSFLFRNVSLDYILTCESAQNQSCIFYGLDSNANEISFKITAEKINITALKIPGTFKDKDEEGLNDTSDKETNIQNYLPISGHENNHILTTPKKA